MRKATSTAIASRTRSFDPGDKFASDAYILATSFNSLLARSFDISKEQVVGLKMEGKMSWNQSKAAGLLGISRKQLRTKMKNHNLLPAAD